MKTVADLGEFNLLEKLQQILSPSHPDILVGLGDDAAVVAPPHAPIVMTTDAMVEGVHFKHEWASAQQIAHKALASTLSDLAGKCAKPAYALITLGLPGETELKWIYEFYQCLAQLQREWNLSIVGGDTVRSPQFWISIAAYGVQTTQSPLRIDSAQAGDWIIVSGTLGDAAAGLGSLLHPGQTCDLASLQFLQNRLHLPTPRLNEAMQIASIAVPNSMTDISDGLARDLRKICKASGLGAHLQASQLPCSDALRQYAGEKAPEYAWRGGEEYELLLTLSPEQGRNLINQWDKANCPLHHIGELTSSTDIIVDGMDPSLEGFDHFKTNSPRKSPT
ncbi:MAG: thiamine-phosphate kinase [Candidatus Hinthialibacter antarcticus]|nr:thiamine-phosphate kinase [Candidatus Hinthialibacter antarcticus]